MANQAIALQARAPQTDFMGRAIQQNAQMMNMMSQRRALQRQAAVAQQEMELARSAEARAAAKEGRDIQEFQLKLANDAATIFKDGLASWVQPGDVAAAQALRDQVVGLVPAWDKIIPPADVLANNPKARQLASMKASEIIEYTTTKPEVEVQVQPGTGVLQEVRTGGIEGISPRGAFELPEYEIDPNAGKPSAAPQSAFPATAARATDAQIDEAARKILNGAGIAELGIGPEDYDRATERANQITAGDAARIQPISMTTAPQMGGQPDMTAVVQDMMSSKQISQSNLQLMREMAGPDKDQQLAQILRSNGIQIVPDAQPGMRSAVFRPGQDAAPQMQLAQSMEGYRPTGRAARGRDPLLSPSQAPSAAGAVAEAQREPIPQAAARAEAQREPIPQAGARAAETERASKQAQADVDFLEKYQSDKRTAQEALMLINRMIGDTNLVKGRLVYPKGGRPPAPGFEDVVGATWRPGFRLIEGTEAYDFDRMLKQLEGSAFLTAYERLKGGGPIASIEGEKGTTAVTRLARGLTEKEFVVAAREFEASIRDAIRRADERYARVKGQKQTRQGATVDDLIRKYGG